MKRKENREKIGKKWVKARRLFFFFLEPFQIFKKVEKFPPPPPCSVNYSPIPLPPFFKVYVTQSFYARLKN